ncbi:MAG: hypothetical protein CFE21_08985 [Bacteroidetes bacterium B1(2017)]|nr:MAG: hypothetical protein CFE21_08985 [Bacteroidetes bacterium B1(2017)]
MEHGNLIKIWGIALPLLIVFVFLNSCGEKPDYNRIIQVNNSLFKGKIEVLRIDKLKKYSLSIENYNTGKTDKIYTPYEIFKLDTGDINQDGKFDLCIGIIKPTPFDTIYKKRLFIFQIDRDYIRPLWLSSRLVRPLEDFCVINSKGLYSINSIERQSENQYSVQKYTWASFGLVRTNNIKESIRISEAQKLLNNPLE